MKRKLMAMILTMAMTSSMLAGCGSSDSSAAEADEAAETTEEAVSEETENSSEDEEIHAWEEELVDTYKISGDESYTWGYITMSFTDTFCSTVQNTVEEYTKQHFPNVKLNIGDGENDINKQMELMENFITQGVDAILLTPVDSDGDVAVCGVAKEAGVPVINITAEPNCTEQDHFFVGSDHYLSGQLQGEYLRDKAMDITEDWITQYGEDIDAIVAANDEMAMGALNALQGAGIEGVVICGIDANDDAKKAVESGGLGCTVFQNAAKQGQWGAIAAYTACSSDVSPEFIEIPYEIVTKDNLADYQ